MKNKRADTKKDFTFTQVSRTSQNANDTFAQLGSRKIQIGKGGQRVGRPRNGQFG